MGATQSRKLPSELRRATCTVVGSFLGLAGQVEAEVSSESENWWFHPVCMYGTAARPGYLLCTEYRQPDVYDQAKKNFMTFLLKMKQYNKIKGLAQITPPFHCKIFFFYEIISV